MIVELLSSDYNQIDHNPAADVAAGTMTTIEDIHGFPIATVDISVQALGAFVTKASKIRAPKDAVTIKEGEALYWTSGGTDKLTNIAGSDILVGFAVKDAASGVANVICDFDGRAAFLKA